MTSPSDDAPDDRARVAELLGREPRGHYAVVVRDATGDPVVLRNAPFLDDGTPMPTRYWLIAPDENRRIGQLEADGGVDAAEAAIPADELDDLLRLHPELLHVGELALAGPTVASLARVEVGADDVPDRVVLDRDAGEEIFRIVATDTASDRAFHPGLPSAHVDTIVATCCIVLAFLRRLHLGAAELLTGPVARG